MPKQRDIFPIWKMKVPFRLKLFFIQLSRFKKSAFFIFITLFFMFLFFREIGAPLPRYEELAWERGTFEKCWRLSMGGKNPSRFLAVQLRETKYPFLLPIMRGQYDVAKICQQLNKNPTFPIQIVFEKRDSSVFDHTKHIGMIWALQQGNKPLIDYHHQYLIHKENKRGVIMILGFFVVFTAVILVWGIKDTLYPRTRVRKKNP